MGPLAPHVIFTLKESWELVVVVVFFFGGVGGGGAEQPPRLLPFVRGIDMDVMQVCKNVVFFIIHTNIHLSVQSYVNAM